MPEHNTLAGTSLHEPFHYVQTSDPGTVGAGKYWMHPTTGVLQRRDATNTGWVAVTSVGGQKLGYTIAASNTTAALKNVADYICTGTNDEVTWQTAIDALETGVSGNTGGAKTLYVLPGAYSWANTVNAKSCQIIGTSAANSGVRVFWDGADNAGPALLKVDPVAGAIIGGKSYWYMHGINFRPGLNHPSCWLDFTDGTRETIDTSNRMNECDFYGGYVQIKIDQWVNIHWDHLRFDRWKTWAIQATPISTNNLSTFRLGQFSFDSQGTVGTEGFMFLDLSANPPNIGTLHFQDARMEVNQNWGGRQGVVVAKVPAAAANPRPVKIEFENITYQDVDWGDGTMTSDCLLYIDAQGGSAVNIQMMLNNVAVDHIASIIGGDYPTSAPAIPVQDAYGFLAVNIIPDGMSVITDGINIVARTTGTITDALRIRKAGQSADCFQIGNDGEIVRGLGSVAPAIGIYVDAGAPSAGRGSNGSIYQRTDGSGTTDNLYVKRGGAWVGIA